MKYFKVLILSFLCFLGFNMHVYAQAKAKTQAPIQPTTGFFSYYSVLGYESAREYDETELTDSLINKKKYHIKFYVSLSDSSSLAVSKIGVYFSDTLYTTNSFRTLSFMPQIVNPSSNLLSDKTNWMKVEGNYVANGGEKFIIIGTFADSSQIDTTYIGNGFNAFWRVAYYYIDDVSVTLYDSTISVNELKANNQIEIFPNPVASTLHFKNLDLIQSTILKIENMFGQTIMEVELKENEINVADLLPGLYFLKIKDEQGYKVAKFLKE